MFVTTNTERRDVSRLDWNIR